MAEVLPSTPVEFLKGVGPKRSDALVSELGIRTCMDLLLHLPFRYEDRTQFHRIVDIQSDQTAVQLVGTILQAKEVRAARGGSRLVATFDDGESTMELQWFRGAKLNKLRAFGCVLFVIVREFLLCKSSTICVCVRHCHCAPWLCGGFQEIMRKIFAK